MHVIIVGQANDPRSSAAIAAFRVRDDVTVESVADVLRAAAIVEAHAKEPSVLVLLADREDDIAVADLPLLAARGVPSIVLCTSESRELRASAFRAGASDVFFPPHDPLRLEASCMALLGGHVRAAPRAATRIPATIRTAEGSELEATIVNVSQGGLRVDVAGVLARAAIVEVTLTTRNTMPPLFARVVASTPPAFGRQDLRLQWVGLTAAEAQEIASLVSSLLPGDADPVVSPPAVVAPRERAARSVAGIVGIVLVTLLGAGAAWISAHRPHPAPTTPSAADSPR